MTYTATHDQIEHASLFEHLDSLRFPDSFDQSSRDFCARLVSMRVHNSTPRVRGFLAKLEFSPRCEIEIGTSCMQLAHTRRTFLDENLDRRRIA